MKKIEFRGISIDTKEWVYGYYYTTEYVDVEKNELYTVHNILSNTTAIPFEVIPETVGQYTSKVDRKFKKIFEGDIIKYSSYYFGDYLTPSGTYPVEWDEDECSYNSELTQTGYADGPHWCEVIGTIHDKLLESKNKQD